MLRDVGGMDSWEFNKIAGAVLTAVLLAFGAGTVAEVIHGGLSDGKKGKPGYELPVTAPAKGGAPAVAAPAFKFADVAGLLQAGSADNGRALFALCRACHTAEKDGKPLVGPNLWGVVGKAVASNAGFPRYSSALKGHTGTWTFEKLAVYLNDPRGAIPGNQMAFAGVKNSADLADLLVYLRTLSDNPVALPN